MKNIFLSEKMINYCLGVNQKESKFPRRERFIQALKSVNNSGIAATISTNSGNRPVDNFIIQETNNKENQNKLEPKVIGGIGEKDSNNGTQWKNAKSNI